MWFPSSSELVRVLLVTPVAYLAAVLVIRVSGKRSLAKLNAFDLVVTVALGSVLASIVTSSDLAAATGVIGMGVLLLMQVTISWLTSRHPQQDGVVRAEPVLLVRDGELLASAVEEARLTPGEVLQAVRSSGQGSLDDIAAVCLESDGTLWVISRSNLGDGSALADLADRGWAPPTATALVEGDRAPRAVTGTRDRIAR